MNFPLAHPVLNRLSPQARGLLAWWPTAGYRFAHTSQSKLYDLSGRSLDLTVYYAPAVADNPIMGRGFDFTADGNLYFYRDGVDNIYGTAFSVCAWVISDDVGNNNRAIMTHRGAGHPLYFQMDYYSDTARFLVSDNSGAISVATSGTLSTGTLYHIVGVRNGDTNRIYVNGVEGTSDTDAKGASSGALRLAIGNLAGAGGMADGRIFDTRIYNYALSLTEIKALYDPSTRWDLYRGGVQLFPGTAAAVALTRSWGAIIG